jgi:hypothetical protein
MYHLCFTMENILFVNYKLSDDCIGGSIPIGATKV